MKEHLQQLRSQLARKTHLEATLRQLYEEKRTLEPLVNELYDRSAQERRDVEKLEGRSLAAYFYTLVGSIDEKLDKERSEAYEAAVRFDAKRRELDDVEDSIYRAEEELRGLEGCEYRYALAIEEKAAALKASNAPQAQAILDLEAQLTALEGEGKEVEEALSAGNGAWSAAQDVARELDEAEGWSTWDLFGGGIVADMIKHDHLDSAQEKVEVLQVQLRRFKTELADVHLASSIQISLDGFARFADYFFDGIFMDLAVRDHIHSSQEQVEKVCRQIEEVISRLRTMEADLERRRSETQSQLNNLVTEA